MNSFLPSNIYPGFCDLPDPHWLIFSEAVPGMVYYSHLPIAIIILFLGSYILYKNFNGLPNRSLFLLTLSYAFWVLLDSVFWASNRGDVVTFVWSMQIIVEPIIYISAFYLMYSLIKGKDPGFINNFLIGLLYLPVVLFVPTKLMLYAFDEATCLNLEGPLATFYTYGIEVIILLWIFFFAARESALQTSRKNEIRTLTLGITCLLLMFSIGNILGSTTGDWQFAHIGLFTMPIFLSIFAYSIIKFATFRIKLFSTLAFVFALIALNFSTLFITDINTYRTVGIIVLVFVCVFGILIIKATAREIKQREEIENLAIKLERANTRLLQLDKQKSEFVSIASHQLRSPLTSIAGYASLLREGSYGVIPQKMLEPLDRIEKSARFMAESIEDYLNVSRIESGNMKYHLADFNLRDETEKICDDIRAEALRKGIILVFKTNLTAKGVVNADLGKTQQILHNLINNALKYTPKGTIMVTVHDKVAEKCIYVDIVDTGIGMDQETLDSIFQKFERGNKANSVNVKGTGLGLYVALKMAEAMNGTITAHSEGEGKGSRFTLMMPFVL
jgi:signal transduction histidine kinase